MRYRTAREFTFRSFHKLGLDLDDVVLHTMQLLCEWHNETHGTTLRLEDYAHTNVRALWEVELEEMLDRSEAFHWLHADELKPLRGSQRTIRRLHRRGIELHAVTYRSQCLRELTEEVLVRHFERAFLHVYCCGYGEQGKVPLIPKEIICKMHELPLMIEDSLSTAQRLAEKGHHVLLLDTVWNQSKARLHPNILRVLDWREIDQLLLGDEWRDRVIGLIIELTNATFGVLGGLKMANQSFEELETGAVVIANHQSWWDIPLIQCMFPHRACAWVAKAELFKVPVLGPFIKWQNSFPINRKDGRSMAAAKQEAVRRARNGEVVVIFPEGTRNKLGGIGPFPTTLAMKIAQEAEVPVYHVGIRGSRRSLRHPLGQVVLTVDREPLWVSDQANLKELNSSSRERLAALTGLPLLERST